MTKHEGFTFSPTLGLDMLWDTHFGTQSTFLVIRIVSKILIDDEYYLSGSRHAVRLWTTEITKALLRKAEIKLSG